MFLLVTLSITVNDPWGLDASDSRGESPPRHLRSPRRSDYTNRQEGVLVCRQSG